MSSTTPIPARWIEFPAVQQQEHGTVRILRRPDSPGVDELRLRIRNDAMREPYIFETRSERRLHFTGDCTQSTMLLRDPTQLVAQYTRKMMAFLLIHPMPRRILILGLGGAELPRFCYHRLPLADITVVEVSADVIALRDEFCIPQDDARFRVVHGDGSAYVRELTTPVDVILVDAFDRDGIAHSLSTSQFYSRAVDCLSNDGLLVMNFAGERERYTENLRHAARAFGGNLRLVPTSEGNLVLFATRRPAPRSISDELELLSLRLQQTLQLDFPRYLRRLCQGESLHRSRP